MPRVRRVLLALTSPWLLATAMGCSDELPAPAQPPTTTLPGGLDDVSVVPLPDVPPPDTTDDADDDTAGDTAGDTADGEDASDDDLADSATDTVVADTAPDVPPTPMHASCLEVHDDPAVANGDGLYTLTVGGESFEVWCDLDAGGSGGWTLAATISSTGEARGEGPWRPEAEPNLWETPGTVLGTPDPALDQDFRSRAFDLVGASELRITYNDQFLLRTTLGCLDGRPLSTQLAERNWFCHGLAQGGPHDSYDQCSLVCGIGSQDSTVGEPDVLLGGVTASRIFLKAGEADAADPGYLDRVYLSTDRRSFPHYVGGLGASCADDCGGIPGGADVSLDEDSVAVPGDGHFYGLWVR